MKYQLWAMVSYGDGEPLTPFTLLKESDNFDEIYYEFNSNRGTPCVILLKEGKEIVKIDKNTKIYESPDNGKTVYGRSFGDINNRIKIN